jgi:L-lactate dehydrogenase complex protein LldG
MNARDEILARIQRSFLAVPRSSADDHAAIPRTYVQSGTLDPEARLELFEERLRDYGTEVYRCATAQLPETIALAMNAAGISSILVADEVANDWLPTANMRQGAAPPNDEFSRQDAVPAGPSSTEASPQGTAFALPSSTESSRQGTASAVPSSTQPSGVSTPEAPANKNPAALKFFRDSKLSHNELDRNEGILTTCAAAIALTGTIILRHSRDGRRALTLIPDYHLCIVRAAQVVETVSEGIRAIETPGSGPLTAVSGPSATADIEMTRIKGVHGPRRLAVILVLS